MCFKVLLVTFALILQLRTPYAQRQWVPPTTTAAEMWNPYTWYWPYAIAASEGYATYFQNAQQITNQLYQQAYATNAFWWTNRPNSNSTGPVVEGVPSQAGGAAGQAGGQAGQAGSQAGQAGGQAGQAGGQAGQAGGQAGQAGGQAGQAGGQAGQTGNQATGQAGQATGQGGGGRPVANMAQGGTGWA